VAHGKMEEMHIEEVGVSALFFLRIGVQNDYGK
jgi:hypothetical protein